MSSDSVLHVAAFESPVRRSLSAAHDAPGEPEKTAVAIHRPKAMPAFDVQEKLWQAYVGTGFGFGTGISAMPSLHVATSFSFVLLGFQISRRLGIAFAAFCAMILIGSVRRGWHYAIDGYAAIIGTWAIWWGVGRLLDRQVVSRLLWGER